MTAAELAGDVNPLAAHYRAFAVDRRLLLTGHSHQAWPDRARDGVVAAFEDAAALADRKWERAAERAERVRAGWARLLGDPKADLALGASTHDLLVRLLSALPWRERRRVVTTDGEFHSARRQLARLQEEGVEVVRVPARPGASVGERLAAATDDATAVVLVSTVFYANAEIAGGLRHAMEAAARHGAELVLDTYHQLDAVPFSLPARGLEAAWVVGGGYKYCQLGEGNCFLRVPPGRNLRPVVTGWFAEFERLEAAAGAERVAYGGGAAAFAGSTYDPTSHYRAAAVFDFFDEMGLTPELLREVSQRQMAILSAEVDALDLDPALLGRDPDLPLECTGGFLALRSPRAVEISAGLARREVWTDARGDLLRLGPAPYLSDRQLRDAVGVLGEVVTGLGS